MPLREGFGIRLGAYLIDAIIMMVVVMGLVMMIFTGTFAVGFGGGGAATTTVDPGTVQLAGIIGSLLALGYASLEIFLARSVGKMALGLIIRSENAAPAPVGQLATRYVVKYSGSILGLLMFITGVEILGMLGNIASLVIVIGCFFVLGQKRQAFHDMIAKTAVYKLNPAVQQGFQPVMPSQGGYVPPSTGQQPPAV